MGKDETGFSIAKKMTKRGIPFGDRPSVDRMAVVVATQCVLYVGLRFCFSISWIRLVCNSIEIRVSGYFYRMIGNRPSIGKALAFRAFL